MLAVTKKIPNTNLCHVLKYAENVKRLVESLPPNFDYKTKSLEGSEFSEPLLCSFLINKNLGGPVNKLLKNKPDKNQQWNERE